MIDDYLTEENLGKFLRERFNNEITSPRLKLTDGLFLPDYLIEDLKVVIEYDGPRHYTQASVAVRDFKKAEVYSKNGYDLISIPYFVQLDENVISHLFQKYIVYMKNAESFNNFPHGFISDKVILPCDFCSLGVERFNTELNSKFIYIKEEINNSLLKKINNKRSYLEVFPKS